VRLNKIEYEKEDHYLFAVTFNLTKKRRERDQNWMVLKLSIKEAGSERKKEG
jgi:hypothetical protein